MRAFVAILLPVCVGSFVITPRCSLAPSFVSKRAHGTALRRSAQQPELALDMSLTDEKVSDLFAWVTQAFAGDQRYNDLVLALVAVFGNLPAESPPMLLLRRAVSAAPKEDELTGEPFSMGEREASSLGAMGAAQWSGMFMTRPHALLSVRGLSSAEQWIKALPRGCRRTLAKATPEQQNFTVVAKPIVGDEPAPHSSLAHFRCVVEHEVRLLATTSRSPKSGSSSSSASSSSTEPGRSVNKKQEPAAASDGTDPSEFLSALGEAVGRYMGTTRMAGEVREYRCCETGRVIAFAHEVRKGSVMRGQWFYATDDAAKRFVWFHSVSDLVRRAIETRRAAAAATTSAGGSQGETAGVLAAEATALAAARAAGAAIRAAPLGSMLETSSIRQQPAPPPPPVDVVDLGPSGSDAFSDLKARYGFESVGDWPAAADYQGPFVHSSGEILGN